MINCLFNYARLTRIDSSLIASSIVFIPLWLHGYTAVSALLHSLPVLTISMGGFILNDVADAEKDAINHPTRPIPNGGITELKAMIVYFALLALTLIIVKVAISNNNAYLYLVFALLFMNYNYLVERFTFLKNIYVGAVSSLPFFIAVDLIESTKLNHYIPLSIFLFITGREILMDILDMKGDDKTLANISGGYFSTYAAFVLQIIGILILICVSNRSIETVLSVTMLFLTCIFIYSWRKECYRLKIIHFMKLQMLLGLIFLVP